MASAVLHWSSSTGRPPPVVLHWSSSIGRPPRVVNEHHARSVHIDPLGTSAWNTVVRGRKLWVLFPPGTPKSVVKAKYEIKSHEDDEAVNYFADLIPRVKAAYPDVDVYQFIQYPGETLFVPGGWWHAVVNLDDTIAVTQNFCNRANFENVWRKTRSGRKKMACKWLRLLKVSEFTLKIFV